MQPAYEWSIRLLFAAVPTTVTAVVGWRRHRELTRLILRLEQVIRKQRPEGDEAVAQDLAASAAPGSLVSAVETELKESLGETIVGMPESERLVITLYYYEELPMHEIAEILGVSESSTSQLHAKAILRLKSRLAERGVSLETPNAAGPGGEPNS